MNLESVAATGRSVLRGTMALGLSSAGQLGRDTNLS